MRRTTTVLAGHSGTAGACGSALARLTGNGVFDVTFGIGGQSNVDFGRSETVEAMLLLSDGKLGVTVKSPGRR